MTPTIRTATTDDLPHIIALLAQLAPDIPAREDPSRLDVYASVLKKTEEQGQRLLVAEDSGRIVATLALVIVENLSHQGAPYAILENIVVDESARGNRYGEALVAAAIQQAREAGCYKITLTSNERRTEAHRFYERLGFQRSHEAFRIAF